MWGKVRLSVPTALQGLGTQLPHVVTFLPSSCLVFLLGNGWVMELSGHVVKALFRLWPCMFPELGSTSFRKLITYYLQDLASGKSPQRCRPGEKSWAPWAAFGPGNKWPPLPVDMMRLRTSQLSHPVQKLLCSTGSQSYSKLGVRSSYRDVWE